ncbi:hypothetical protein M405DRAFT_830717 [Rhizopogon salebrosus TDB-379]|nr:hypothetical protein M405DRAFT_830717 [Rhizopogon salebrosus TDB-379]
MSLILSSPSFTDSVRARSCDASTHLQSGNEISSLFTSVDILWRSFYKYNAVSVYTWLSESVTAQC